MRRHHLSGRQRAIVQPLPPQGSRGGPRVDDRRAIEGISRRFRAGTPWREAPERHGPRMTLRNRFARWRAEGVRGRILDPDACDGDAVMIDSACIRRRRHRAAGNGGL